MEAESTCEVIKNEKCDVCEEKEALYKCPRCETRSCSLYCVNKHKQEIKCDGSRDKTQYVPISKFSNLNLLSDYRFLEDVTRTIDSSKRNPLKMYTRFNRQLPVHLFKLKKAAAARKTNLEFLPQHFTRHQENTTILNFKSGIIYWRVQFVFAQAGNIQITEEKCDENDRLSNIISKYVEVETCPDIYKQHLKYYISCGVSGLEVLLKAECVKEKSSFFLLDMHSSLKDNLEDRIIIESPVIYVIFKDYKYEYNILDSDIVVNSIHNRKTMLEGFTPFNFYDTISYSKGSKKEEEAASSIHESTKQLKTFFGIQTNRESDEEDNAQKKKESAPRKYKELSIPNYDDL